MVYYEDCASIHSVNSYIRHSIQGYILINIETLSDGTFRIWYRD